MPLLGFIVVLGPLTAAIANAADTGRFWEVFPYLAQHFILIPGPLWFARRCSSSASPTAQWRKLFGTPLTASERIARPVPRGAAWLLSALLTGIAALAIRQFIPVGVNIVALQLGYFATYIVLFAAGIAAWRYDWIRQLNWNNAKTAIYAGAIALPLMPLASPSPHIIDTAKASFGGGLSWQAILYALWEPFVAWGLIAAWLLVHAPLRQSAVGASGHG